MKKFLVLLNLFVLAALALAACGGPVATETPSTEAAATEEPATTGTEEPAGTGGAPSWPAPIAEEPELSRRPATAEETAAGDALANQIYPYVDYLAEALAHQIVSEPVDPVVATEAEPKTFGAIEEFWILNTDLNTWNLVEMKLLGISEHAYFWVDTDREPDAERLQNAMDAFEGLYEQDRAVFGAEGVPGIDGDPHIYVLHPSALKLCNVSESTSHQCGILGYFFSVNQFPQAVISHSNQHEGLIMNYDGGVLGGEQYAETLGHEFRHLIEYWYDKQSETWEVEGSAVMAEQVLGFQQANIAFANLFMEDPDVQLNAWAEGQASLVHYGQGYVINRYIYDRFGEAFYSQWVQDPDGGLVGLTEVLAANGYADLTGEQVWLDWLAALVLFDDEGTPDIYKFTGDFGITPVGETLVTGLPKTIEDDVHQYAADIYQIRSDTDVTVTFTGTTLTSAFGNLPPSGQYFWYSGRAAGALPKLTLSADLSGVSAATLQFSTYYKYTKAFGFGYVVISTDGGQTWSELVSTNMRGDDPADDPAELALTNRFFTGVAPGAAWGDESIDLTPYAGQAVLIRFESDGNDQSLGFAIDNIAIPEIGFFDDVESENAAWQTEGWNRVTAYIPQTFHLLVITFVDGVPSIQVIQLDETNAGTFDISGLTTENNSAYLIVAASAPDTQSTAAYSFEVAPK